MEKEETIPWNAVSNSTNVKWMWIAIEGMLRVGFLRFAIPLTSDTKKGSHSIKL